MKVTAFGNKTFNLIEKKVSGLVAGNGAKTKGSMLLLCSERCGTKISATFTRAEIRRVGGVKAVVAAMIEKHYLMTLGAKACGCGSELVFSLNKYERAEENRIEKEIHAAYAARDKVLGYGFVTDADIHEYGDALEAGKFDVCEQIILSKAPVLSSCDKRFFARSLESAYRNHGDGRGYENYDWQLGMFFKYCSHLMKLYSKVFGGRQ